MGTPAVTLRPPELPGDRLVLTKAFSVAVGRTVGGEVVVALVMDDDYLVIPTASLRTFQQALAKAIDDRDRLAREAVSLDGLS